MKRALAEPDEINTLWTTTCYTSKETRWCRNEDLDGLIDSKHGQGCPRLPCAGEKSSSKHSPNGVVRAAAGATLAPLTSILATSGLLCHRGSTLSSLAPGPAFVRAEAAAA